MTTFRNQPAFVVVPGRGEEQILLSQRDIREVQLAKAAIAAGIKTLMQYADITYAKIDRLFLAGGFGSFIDVENACRLGLLPAELKAKVVKIGNGAGLGAKQVLADGAELKRAQKLLKNISYLELSAHTAFQSLFVDEMFFFLNPGKTETIKILSRGGLYMAIIQEISAALKQGNVNGVQQAVKQALEQNKKPKEILDQACSPPWGGNWREVQEQ